MNGFIFFLKVKNLKCCTKVNYYSNYYATIPKEYSRDDRSFEMTIKKKFLADGQSDVLLKETVTE
jgi:hypothetical protein